MRFPIWANCNLFHLVWCWPTYERPQSGFENHFDILLPEYMINFWNGYFVLQNDRESYDSVLLEQENIHLDEVKFLKSYNVPIYLFEQQKLGG